MLISEFLGPEPGRLWTLVRQVGVEHAIAFFARGDQYERWLKNGGEGEPVDPGPRDEMELATTPWAVERPWEEPVIAAMQKLYAAHGLTIVGFEEAPPLERARLGVEGGDEEIDDFIEQVRAMGRLGIGVLCYNWMARAGWSRTDVEVPLRAGALGSGFDQEENETRPPLAEPGEITEDQLWASFEHFLHRVVPVAEEAGVRLALHPDDPPVPSFRGVPRIMRSIDAFRRVVDLIDSPSNAVTVCQGNFTLMTDDLPSVIRELGSRDKIAFVHFRDVVGTPERFHEVFHGEGKTDLVACMEAYRDVGFSGPMRPDHVPTLYGESNLNPGYATMGRLYAIGYIRGLKQAVYDRRR